MPYFGCVATEIVDAPCLGNAWARMRSWHLSSMLFLWSKRTEYCRCSSKLLKEFRYRCQQAEYSQAAFPAGFYHRVPFHLYENTGEQWRWMVQEAVWSAGKDVFYINTVRVPWLRKNTISTRIIISNKTSLPSEPSMLLEGFVLLYCYGWSTDRMYDYLVQQTTTS